MQIVIDIPNRLKEIADEYSKNDNKNLDELTYYRMNGRLALFCISKGTPLPKGHGDLIDSTKLRYKVDEDGKILITSETIIEADKGSESE